MFQFFNFVSEEFPPSFTSFNEIWLRYYEDLTSDTSIKERDWEFLLSSSKSEILQVIYQ